MSFLFNDVTMNTWVGQIPTKNKTKVQEYLLENTSCSGEKV